MKVDPEMYMKTKGRATICPTKSRTKVQSRMSFCKKKPLCDANYDLDCAFHPFFVHNSSRFLCRQHSADVTPPSWRLLCRLEASATPEIKTLETLMLTTRDRWL